MYHMIFAHHKIFSAVSMQFAKVSPSNVFCSVSQKISVTYTKNQIFNEL